MPPDEIGRSPTLKLAPGHLVAISTLFVVVDDNSTNHQETKQEYENNH